MSTLQELLETNIYPTSQAAANKRFIETYLAALSGRPKPKELVAIYVADPSLIDHIQEVEAAFPAYELTPREIIAERSCRYEGRVSGCSSW